MLTLEFYLEGCGSLKEKRARLSGLRHRLGRKANLAVAEDGWRDHPQRSCWRIVALGESGKVVDRALAQVERYVQEALDVRIVECHRERL